MSEQDKKWLIIYHLLNAETKPCFLCQPNVEKRKILREKQIFKEKEEWRIE